MLNRSPDRKKIEIYCQHTHILRKAKEDVDADKRQQEMKSNREKLRAGFNDAANELVKQFNKAVNEYLANNYDNTSPKSYELWPKLYAKEISL